MRREAAYRGLICADDDITRRAVRVMMLRRGFEVVAEVDAATPAVEAAESWNPDVIVVDLAVTGSLGLGALRRLLDVAPRACAILLSSFSELDLAANEAGAFAVVSDRDLRELDRCLERIAERTPTRVEAGTLPGEPAT